MDPDHQTEITQESASIEIVHAPVERAPAVPAVQERKKRVMSQAQMEHIRRLNQKKSEEATARKAERKVQDKEERDRAKYAALHSKYGAPAHQETMPPVPPPVARQQPPIDQPVWYESEYEQPPVPPTVYYRQPPQLRYAPRPTTVLNFV